MLPSATCAENQSDSFEWDDYLSYFNEDVEVYKGDSVMNIGDHKSEVDSCDLEGDGTDLDQDMEGDGLDLIWKDATADVITNEFGYVYDGTGLEWLQDPIW